MGTKYHPLADCDNCPLQSANTFVPSEGPAKADVAIVGEAPGYQEYRHGKPFVGPSGKLLVEVLKHAGYKREEVFLTNACLCRPPDNATPPASAVRACNLRLVSELQEREVKTVVVAGNTAAQALLDSRAGITQLRVGPGKTSRALPGVRVIPTVHPAACLRSADLFPSLVTDILKVKGVSSEPWIAPTWRLFDDGPSAIAALQELTRRGGEVVVDIEVGIEKDISFDHPDKYDLLCVGLAYARDRAIVLGERALEDRNVRNALGDCLRAESIKVIAHNGKFDLAGLYRHCNDITLDFDTMLMNYCLDERQGVHSLGYLGVELLGMPDWKYEIKKYVQGRESYANVPRPILYKYNAYDVCGTYALKELLSKRFDEEAAELDWPWEHLHLPKKTLWDVHKFLCEASNQLKFVELNGMKVDLEYNRELAEEELANLATMEDFICDVVGDDFEMPNMASWKPGRSRFNPRSPAQVKEYLYQHGITVDSTDKDTLAVLMERAEPMSATYKFLNAMLEHRKEAKLYGTYVKGIHERMYRGRVFPTFLLHGTTSGRLSCRNPNLQNIPRGSTIKKQFVPSKEENVFVQADYGQAELRVVTNLARDTYLQSIFNDPERDLFDELTPILYPNAIKPVEGFSSPDEFAAWKEFRIRVKAYVYGLTYGREAFSIAQEYDIPEREAQQGMNRFFDVIPDIVKWREQVINTVFAGKALVSPFGRNRRFYLITDENKKNVRNEALSFLPQSTASDICLSAFVELRPRLRGRAFIRNLVHDSILAECHRDDAEDVGTIMQNVMVTKAYEALGDWVTFKADVEYGTDWSFKNKFHPNEKLLQ